MDLVTNLTVEDVFFISGRGVVATGRFKNDETHNFKIGASVMITKPNGTTAISLIGGIEEFRAICWTEYKGVGLLLNEIIIKEEIPKGSVITVINES
jgi:translation elongation factor EF-Tu-like GTPase